MMSVSSLSVCVRRGLCTSLARGQLISPPLAVFGTEGKYVNALFSAASKQKALDAVEKDLKSFKDQLSKDLRLKEFLYDPSINKTLKIEGVQGACDKLKMNSLTKNLLVAMAENGRYNLIDAVSNAFASIMAAYRGEVVCHVTTAKNLDANLKKEVDAAVASFLKNNEKSLIHYHVDPSIVGGMVVSIGDRFVDMSIASKIKKYEEIIKSAA